MTKKSQHLLCLSWLKKYYILSLFWLLATTFGSAQSISELEYFFGTDPGFGNGTMVSANANSGELTQSLSLSIAGLDEGFQQLTIRALDDQNTWSLYQRVTFFITEETGGQDPVANIAGAEYWFDTDPGLGNGNALTITGNPSETTESFAIPLSTLEVGFHSLGVRTQNTDGIWSLFDKRIFFVFEETSNEPISNLAAAEYWFDTDPGLGNGTALNISGAPEGTTESYVIPLGNLETGFHKLGLRAQNLDGTWSLYEKRVFYIFEAEEFNVSPISELEFLYDAELGFGSGQTVPITATGNPDEYLVEIPTDMVTCDLHDLWVSVKNEDGGYSLYNILVDVDVFDNQDPTIVVFDDITVALDASGAGSITIDDVNNGTFDDCELVSVVMDPTTASYDCNDLGTQMVTVTATDAENKISTLEVDINVVDNIDPVAVGQNITVQLDTDGSVTVDPNLVENGSTDNCSIASRSLSTVTFTCDNLGDNNVDFTVTDTYGNTNTVTVTITVEDTVNPVAIGQDITVQLDASGNTSITANDVDASTDNCTIVDKSIDITSFDCTNIGENTVTLTVEDQSGNTANTTVIVTVEDSINPTVVTQNITVQLDASGQASITTADIDNGSTDNCTIASLDLDTSTFTCDDLGEVEVILSVTDQSGNTASQIAIVIIEDAIPPIAAAQNITVALDANGEVTVDPFEVDDGSSDNCLLDVFLDTDFFTCDNLGENTVLLTASDNSGNTDDIGAIITVIDDIEPTVVTQNITIQLDTNGEASITTADIDNGSTDNCTIASLALDTSTFTCDDVGEVEVTLSVTDQSGNIGTGTATVTIEDSVSPTVNTQNIIIELDASGNATIIAGDIDNGSGDNCDTIDLEIDLDTFDCSNLGDNIVTLTANDISGNSDSATAIVSVEDNIDPVAQGQDIIINLNGAPSVSIVPVDIDNGSFDNCDFVLSVDQDTFTAVGVYPVILTITDSSGNTDTVEVTVTVEEETLGIESVSFTDKQIRIFPVPVNDILSYQTEFTIDQFIIYDIIGKTIKRVEVPNGNIRVSNLEDGVYFIKFKSGNSYVTKRFVKKQTN